MAFASAPVANSDNHVVAAIGVSAPVIRMTPAREEEIIEALRHTASLVASKC